MIRKLIKKHTVLFVFFILFTVNFLFAYLLFLFMFSYIYYKFSNKSLSNSIQFFASLIYLLSSYVVLFFYSDMINLIGILVFLYIIYFIYINTLLSKLFTDLNIVPQRNNIHESNFDTQKYILSHLNELVLTNKSNTNNQSSESNLKLKKEVYYTVFSVVDDISVFKDISYKNIIIDALKHWQFNKGLIIHNWCLLDDSLHLIVSAKENNIKNLIDDLKIYISQSVILSIQSHNNENFKSNLLASLNKENFHNQLWKNNFELESILSKDSLINKVNFIHNIPRKLGIVALAEDYLYSSAKDYGIRAALIEVESII